MPLYEYACPDCGLFSETRPMAKSALPAPCPRCASTAPRVLSATAVLGHGGARRRNRRDVQPSLVTTRDRPDGRARPDSSHGHVGAAHAGPQLAGGRPWMLGH